MELEEGDLVLCTVDRIIGTNVFVKIHLHGKNIEGSIVTSEIAPGRIRNIRNYVVPKKKIVCKVLRVSGDRVDLSLRRVTQKERKEVLEEYKQEKSYENMIKKILGENANKALENIRKKDRLYNFIQEVKKNPELIGEVVEKSDAEKILEVLKTEKKRNFIITKEISLKTSHPEGLEKIKKTFEGLENVDVKYISAGKYALRTESEDAKKADNYLKSIIAEIEKRAKKEEFQFEILEK